MFNLENVQVHTIISAEKHILRELVEISMKGNNFSLDDEEKYKATWDHFIKEFKTFDTEREMFSIAEVDGRIIGFMRACCKLSMPKQWWLMGLEVREEYRQRGIGTMLIKIAMREVRARYGTSILSYTRKTNFTSLIAHQNAGFRILTDKFERFDGKTVVDGSHWLMRVKIPIENR